MDQQFSNAPLMQPKPGPTGWLPIWIKAVTKPSEGTFAELAHSPEAKASQAYLWIFVTALISFLIAVVIQMLFLSLGFGQQNQDLAGLLGSSLIGLVCAVPVFAGLSVLGFIINTGLVQWVAGLFKGVGTFNQLAYAFGAIAAPITLISSVLSFFYAIPFVGLCLLPVSILLGLYALILEVIAVKGVNKFGWGQAIGSVLVIPAVLFLCSCLVIGILTLLGPAVGNVFSEINQSLQSVP